MNVENYLYTLMTTIMGMSVVFIFLGILCLIMVLMTFVFPSNQNKRKKERPTAQKANSEKENIPGWLLAAIAAYFSEQTDKKSEKASIWKHVRREKKDTWIIMHNIPIKKIGIF